MFGLIGVSDIPNCVNIHDFKCTLMRTMVKRGVYTNYVQHHVVQAQYYKSPSDYGGMKHRLFGIVEGDPDLTFSFYHL